MIKITFFARIFLSAIIFISLFSTQLFAESNSTTIFLSLEESIQIAKDKHPKEEQIALLSIYEYFKLASLQEKINIYDQAITALTKHLDNMQKIFSKGIISKVDILFIQRELAEIKMQQEILRRDVQNQTMRLNQLLEMKLDSNVLVNPILDSSSKYPNFQQWIMEKAINLQKNNTDNKNLSMDSFLENFKISEFQEYRLREIFNTIDETSKNLMLKNETLNFSQEIFQLQKKRFMNSLISSREYLTSLLDLYENKISRVELLTRFETADKQAEELLKSIK